MLPANDSVALRALGDELNCGWRARERLANQPAVQMNEARVFVDGRPGLGESPAGSLRKYPHALAFQKTQRRLMNVLDVVGGKHLRRGEWVDQLTVTSRTCTRSLRSGGSTATRSSGVSSAAYQFHHVDLMGTRWEIEGA
jgi:hypothetical protein